MKVRLASQAGLLALSRALGQVLNALVGIVLVRTLSQLDYGTFRQIFLLVATLVQTELGFVESLYFYLPTMPKLRAVFIRQTVFVLGSTQLLAGSLILIFRQEIARFFNNPGLASCLDLVALYSGLTMMTRIWEAELVADKRISGAALLAAGFESLKVTLMVAALLLSPGIRPLLWALVGAAALKFAAFLSCLFREFRWFTGAGPMGQGLPQVSYAMALWIPAILNGAIGGQAHQYIVSHYFDPTQYGIYSVACFQVPFVAILTNSIGEILLVRATEYCSQRRTPELYTLWMNVCRKTLPIYVAIASVLFVLARPIIVTIFTERYRASAPLFALMVLGLVPYSIFQDGLFRACSAMKTYGMFYALRAVLSVGLGFAGLKLWGLWGVALSSVLTIAIVNLLQLVPAAKILQVPFSKVLPWRDMAKMVVAAALTASAIATLLRVSPSHSISLIAGFPLFGILYGGLVIKLGVISSAEVLVVLRGIRSCFYGRSFTGSKSNLATQSF